jgi:hypothetical protein
MPLHQSLKMPCLLSSLKPRNAFGLLLGILVLSVCWLLGEEKPANALAPKIVLIPAKLNLGNVPQKAQRIFELEIANEGTKTLVVKEVTASCGCTAAVVSQKAVRPHDSGRVRVTFNSGSFRGTIEKSVFIKSNDPQTPVKEFIFSAYVTPGE